MDLNPFDDIGHGLKALSGKIGGLVKKLNPADDIRVWVEKRLKIFMLEVQINVLELMQNIIDKGIDGVQADMQKKIDDMDCKK